jgi:drug/metabolite transporter, DME family
VLRPARSSTDRSSTDRSSTIGSSTSRPTTSRPTTSHGERGLLLVTLAALLWGTTGVVIRRIQDHAELGSSALGAYRLGLAAVVLLPLVRPAALAAALRAAPSAVLLSGVLLGGYQLCYVVAVRDIGVGVATLLGLGLAPVVTVLWEALVQRRRPGGAHLSALGLALGGLVLISVGGPGDPGTAPRPFQGLLAGIACGVGYGASALVSRRAAGQVPALPLAALSTAIGTLVLLPPILLAGPVTAATLLPRTPGDAAGLVYLGVVTTAVAYGLFYAGLRTVPSGVAALLTLVEPLAAAALAVLLLGERLSPGVAVGGASMLAAVALLYRLPGRR